MTHLKKLLKEKKLVLKKISKMYEEGEVSQYGDIPKKLKKLKADLFDISEAIVIEGGTNEAL